MAKNRERPPQEGVRCPACNAQPKTRCVSDGDNYTRPHADRLARYNGLLPTPQAGRYHKPPAGVAYAPDETPSPKAKRKVRV